MKKIFIPAVALILSFCSCNNDNKESNENNGEQEYTSDTIKTDTTAPAPGESVNGYAPPNADTSSANKDSL